MFEVSNDVLLWEKSIEHGLIAKILDRLTILTGEKSRRFVENLEEERKLEEEKELERINKMSESKDQEKKKGRSGVGYTTGTGTVWNVQKYMQEKDNRNSQIQYLIDILTNFFKAN